MSPELIREPMKDFLMRQGSPGAQALFAGVLALAIAAFVLVALRYASFVYRSCHARRGQWLQVAAASLAALVLSAGILWIVVVFWFPFLLRGDAA
jgi:hypothetical protein